MKKQDLSGTLLDIKRLYVDLEKVELECPHCGEKKHLEPNQYFSSPTIGRANTFYTECDKCEGEIYLDIALHAHLEIADPKKSA